MVMFSQMTRLEQARALYVDAYRDAWGCEPDELPPSKWDCPAWLEDAVDSLVDIIAVDEFMRINQ